VSEKGKVERGKVERGKWKEEQNREKIIEIKRKWKGQI